VTASRVAYVLVAAALSVVGYLGGALYNYVIAIAAGLCGADHSGASLDGPLVVSAVVVPYLLVGSWAWLGGWRRVWAWPLGPVAGFAVVSLVLYALPSAHGYCET